MSHNVLQMPGTRQLLKSSPCLGRILHPTIDLRLRAMSLSSCLETLALGVTCCGSLNFEIKNKPCLLVFFPLEA